MERTESSWEHRCWVDGTTLKHKSATAQLTNFCIDPFITSVATSSISADGYAPGNLTSTDPQTKSRGFRVEHFMRPPIHVDFEFNVPINVACVIVSPNLEAGSEMRVEVSGSFQATTPDHHYKLCQGAVINSQRSILVLRNRAYQDRMLHTLTFGEAVKDVLGSYMSLSLVGAELMEQPLKHANILVKLRTLRFTVNRMSGPKPVALKAVEVWGGLSKVSNNKQREMYLTAHSVLPTLQYQLGVFKDTPVTGPKELLKGKQHSHFVCNNVHKEECCSCSPGQHNTLKVHEREGSMFQSQHTCDLETNEQSIMNSCGGSIIAPSTSATPALSWKEKDTQTHTGMKGKFHSSIPSKMSPRNQLGTKSRDGIHFAGCSNEVIPQTVKPEVSFLGNEKFITATGLPPQLSKGPRVVHGPPCDTNLRLQSCIHSKPSTHTPTISASYSHDQTEYCDSSQAERQLSCTSMTSSKSTCTNEVIILEEAQSSKDSNTMVPAQFLDEITCEVMQLPMLLPSGHYVDRSTVDRLANNDAMYGRSPLDPFTGIVFTDNSKPEFCPKTKLQLDEFLSHSGYENTGYCNNRGRTLGSAEEIASHLRTVQGSVKGTKKRSGCEGYTSRSKRSKEISLHSCLVTLDKTLQTEQGSAETPISCETHPAIFPTTSVCSNTSMPVNAQSFPTSLQRQCLDSVTTSKPPTRKRMCDQTNQNAVGGCGNDDDGTGESLPSRAGGSQSGGTSFESEVSCSLDRALENLLSS